MITELANLDKKQLKAWAKEQEKERLAELVKTALLNPIVGLIAGFVVIDFCEYKKWPDSENTVLGPAAANILRTSLVLPPVMDALGKVAELAQTVIALRAMKGAA